MLVTTTAILIKFHVQSCALTIILEYFIFVFSVGLIIPPKNERPTSQNTVVVRVLSDLESTLTFLEMKFR
jgi:hypothetical protein